MYNRYIPQGDGTYKRCPVAEQIPPKKTEPPRPPVPCPVEEPPKVQPIPQAPKPPRTPPKPPQHGPVDGFLRNILPKNFDTGDLMIVLLLLLMAGDCEDDRNTALLTLALYFFF